MKGSTRICLVLVVLQSVGGEEANALSELPFAELLARKKLAEEGKREEALPSPSAVAAAAPPPAGDLALKGSSRPPSRKTFYEDDYEDEKEHKHKKKEEHKIHDILNTSIMALSYLAFGGYLLCMIANAIREKRRMITMTYPTATPTVHNQFLQVLQHQMAHRPSRPFIRFPTVTVHQGGKKRRRRSTQREAPWGEGPPLFSVIDYVRALGY